MPQSRDEELKFCVLAPECEDLADEIAERMEETVPLSRFRTSDQFVALCAAYETATLYYLMGNEDGEADDDAFLGMIAAAEGPVLANPGFFRVVLVPTELEAKERALKLYCALMSRAEGLAADVQPASEAFGPRASGEKGLEFLTFRYDVKAVSEEMKKGEAGFIPRDLEDFVNREGVIQERFWYWDEESATLWQKLSTPASPYALTRETTNLLREHIAEIIHAGAGTGMDFVDLGVGSPEKDRVVLEALVNASPPGEEITYFPVDISFPLLEYTLRQILPLRRRWESENQNGVRVNIVPLIGDFTLLRQHEYQRLLGNEHPRLFALLGNTLGNVVEREMFDCLWTVMDADDFFLLDVEVADETTDEALKEQYRTEVMYNFVFHPLELLGVEKQPFENAMEVEVAKEGRVDFRFSAPVTKEKTWRSGALKPGSRVLSTVKNSRPVAMFCRQPSGGRILMAWSTKYMRKEFESAIGEWFSIKGKWPSGRYVLYLLQKAGRKP